jgi:hypothetical protein
MWNAHKLRTESSRTPNQLWHIYKDLEPPATVAEDEYGVEWDEGDDEQDENDQAVVEPIACPLREGDRQEFTNAISPLVLNDLENFDVVLNRIDEAIDVMSRILN